MTTKEAPAFDMAALAALISDSVGAAVAPLGAKLAALEEKVTKAEQMTPRFQPLRTQSLGPKSVTAGLGKGQQREGSLQNLARGPHGKPLQDWVVKNLTPGFAVGQEIRVNPEAIQRGTETNKDGPVLWSQVLERDGNEGYGRILDRWRLEANGEWSYQVEVPGLTAKNRGMRFDEHELLAA